MAKRNNHRKRNDKQQEINKVLRNYNAKITRLVKKNPSNKEFLPNKILKEEFLASVGNKKDLEEKLDHLQKFSRRGAEKIVEMANGVKVTAWEKKELERNLKKFNNKIEYHARRYKGNAPYLPQKMTMEKLEDMITSKETFQIMSDSLKRFTKKGEEKLIQTEQSGIATKWQMEQLKIYESLDNAQREKERKRLGEKEVKIAGNPQNLTLAQIGRVEQLALKDSNKNPMKMSQLELDRAFHMFETHLRKSYKSEQKQRMLENYITALISEGYSSKLQSLVLHVPLDKFIEILETDLIASIDYIYDPQELALRESQLWDLWEKYAQEENQNTNITIDTLVERLAKREDAKYTKKRKYRNY